MRVPGVRGILITAAVALAVLTVVAATTRKRYVFDLSSGRVLTHYTWFGVQISTRVKDELMAPLLPQQALLVQPEELYLDERSVLYRGPPPSTYAGGLVSECQLLKGALELSTMNSDEIGAIWKTVQARARTRQGIGDVIGSVMDRP